MYWNFRPAVPSVLIGFNRELPRSVMHQHTNFNKIEQDIAELLTTQHILQTGFRGERENSYPWICSQSWVYQLSNCTKFGKDYNRRIIDIALLFTTGAHHPELPGRDGRLTEVKGPHVVVKGPIYWCNGATRSERAPCRSRSPWK